MDNAKRHRCPPDLVLERFARNELESSASCPAWTPHIEQCDACAVRLKRLAADSARLRGSARWRSLADRLKENDLPPVSFFSTIGLQKVVVAGILAAAACAVLIFAWPKNGDRDAALQEQDLAIKGGPELKVTLIRDGRAVAFEAGHSMLRAEDTIQLDWVSPLAGYLAIFLKETGSPVVQLYPEQGGCARVDIGIVELGGALMVDETTKDAVIFGYFSKRDFAVEPLISDMEKGEKENIESFEGKQVRVELKMTGNPH